MGTIAISGGTAPYTVTAILLGGGKAYLAPSLKTLRCAA